MLSVLHELQPILLALQIQQSEVVVRIERGLPIVVEAYGFGQVLDGLAENLLLETDVSDVDAGQGILRLSNQHLLEVEQRVVDQ